MSLINRPETIEERRKKVREFGLLMALVFGVLGAMLLWKSRPATPYVLAVTAFFGLSAILAPAILDPLERVWMKFAEKLSVVMTYVIVTLTFYLAITPIAVLLRLLGKDSLGKHFDRSKDTYWIPVEENGPGTRPYAPY